jgi:hypothetical protein
MAEQPQNFVLEYLRRIDRKIDGLQEGFRLFNVRVAATESHVSGLHVSDVQQTARSIASSDGWSASSVGLS